MTNKNIERLKKFGKKIHEEAKKLRVKDGNKKAYKEYVKLASAKLKAEGFFKK